MQERPVKAAHNLFETEPLLRERLKKCSLESVHTKAETLFVKSGRSFSIGGTIKVLQQTRERAVN